MRNHLISSLLPLVKHYVSVAVAMQSLGGAMMLCKAVVWLQIQWIQANFLWFKRLKVCLICGTSDKWLLWNIYYCRLLSSTPAIPSVPLYLPCWLLFKTGEIMWSGLRAAFACRCREGYIRLVLLYLFFVSGGDAINQEWEEKYNNNAAEIKK